MSCRPKKQFVYHVGFEVEGGKCPKRADVMISIEDMDAKRKDYFFFLSWTDSQKESEAKAKMKDYEKLIPNSRDRRYIKACVLELFDDYYVQLKVSRQEIIFLLYQISKPWYRVYAKEEMKRHTQFNPSQPEQEK